MKLIYDEIYINVLEAIFCSTIIELITNPLLYTKQHKFKLIYILFNFFITKHDLFFITNF